MFCTDNFIRCVNTFLLILLGQLIVTVMLRLCRMLDSHFASPNSVFVRSESRSVLGVDCSRRPIQRRSLNVLTKYLSWYFLTTVSVPIYMLLAFEDLYCCIIYDSNVHPR